MTLGPGPSESAWVQPTVEINQAQVYLKGKRKPGAHLQGYSSPALGNSALTLESECKLSGRQKAPTLPPAALEPRTREHLHLRWLPSGQPAIFKEVPSFLCGVHPAHTPTMGSGTRHSPAPTAG